MMIRIPFLKTRLPEFDSIPAPERQELLDRCNDDSTMKTIARRHMTLMRVGWAFLLAGVVAYFILSAAHADPRTAGLVLVGAVLVSVVWVPASLVLYHRRATRRMRSLLRQTVE